jgi:predicted GIY-YIG superfamily endonuclease
MIETFTLAPLGKLEIEPEFPGLDFLALEPVENDLDFVPGISPDLLCEPVANEPRKLFGDVYLIHFSRPYKGARHYLGFTEIGVRRRLQYHRQGRGAKLLRAVCSLGIKLRVVRTWLGVPQTLERELKNRKKSHRLCPVCRERHARKIARQRARAQALKQKKGAHR